MSFCLLVVLSVAAQTGITDPINVQHNNEFFISEFVHIQEGAEVHVLGDVVIGNAVAQLENEGSLQVHGNFIKAEGAVLRSFNGKLIMRNNYANLNSDQYLEGDFTGDNAISSLVINKNNSNGVVYLKNGDLDIRNELRFKKGRLRTGPSGHDSGAAYPYRVRILNDASLAIKGYAITNSESNYIEGKLRRAVSLGPYFFPVGPQPSQGQGIEGFAMNFLELPPADITGFYDDGTTTPVGAVVNCDFTSSDPTGNDDDTGANFSGEFLPSEYIIDCVTGQWTVEGDSLIYFYDIQFFPSPRVLGDCDFQSYFMSKNGAVEDICPINSYILYEQKFLGNFDIAGVSGPGFTYTGDIAYLEALGENIPELDEVTKEVQLVSQALAPQTQFTLEDITVFPNPVSIQRGEISFEAHVSDTYTVSLYDNVGVLVAFKEVEAFKGVNTLNLIPKTAAPGIYNIVIQNDNGAYRARLAAVH
ncbi:MAG: T9SS type A sorting domain-containing protein [Bacteroidota bacterium]